MVGKWLKRTGKRDQIFLASKYGFAKGSPTYAVDSSAKYTRKACEESLRLLGVESIDLCKLSFLPLSLQRQDQNCLAIYTVILSSDFCPTVTLSQRHRMK
jgi:diketogulonate reductase-like aldo/keto reductase